MEAMFKDLFENNGEDVTSGMIILPLKNVDETKAFSINAYSCNLISGNESKCSSIVVFYRKNNLIGRVSFGGNATHFDLPKITEWAQKAADRMGR